ncbi:hypothetical protein B0T14DRAFT_505729 [Immersiella caudata]|uniref:Uncharacterized protein n=1 Tax=Immersiella caudata TaxID=314043 RepID=A0AA39XFJ2_9PEZI|nr:hypothetical protein B0T14DRAFT_505729 [Immersiella caudata]
MHFTKISALVAQFSLTTASVLGAEEMGRRDWQAARDRAVERAAQFEPRAPMVTAAPRSWESDRDAGLAAAAAAVSSAREAAANFRASFGNGKRDNNWGPGTVNGGQWQDAAGNWQNGPAPAGYSGPWNGQGYDGQNYNNYGPGQWQDAASDWQNGPAPAGYNDPWNGAAANGDNWQSYASDWEAYGSSVAASYSSQYGGDNWQTAAESAKSVASSYKSEYGVPDMTPMPSMATPTMGGGSMGTTVRNQAATPTSNRVQVNGAEGAAVGGAAKVLGVGAVVVAVAAGMI